MEVKQEQPITADFLDSEAQATGPRMYTQQSSFKTPRPSKGTPLISKQIPEADYISFTEEGASKKETLCKSQNFRLESREHDVSI
jgi:hypothetical protein